MTIATTDSLLAAAEVELEAAKHRRELAKAEAAYVLNAARQEGRPTLTADENEKVAQARERRRQANSDIDGIKVKIAEIKELDADEADYQARARQTTPAGQPVIPGDGVNVNGQRAAALPAYDQVVRVGEEPRTYTKQTDPYGRQFLMDVARSFTHQDHAAQQRLARHMTEEKIERLAESQLQRAAGDATTGAFAGLTVPQYLTDMYAPATAGLRPFADICNQHPLPPNGMALDISRITTATSAGLQANELDPASATSIDDTLLAVPVQTIAGQQKMSRQAIDRGTGTEDITVQDLFARYATTLDATLITQATTGLSAVAQSVAYTDASPTAAELYPKILNAAANVEAALLGYGSPTHAIMHSRRWYWLASQLSSTWPLINSAGIPVQAGGVLNPDSSYASGIRGTLPVGLQVVVDNNIATNLGGGTNEDEVYVVPRSECHLWEEPNSPLYIRAEQPAAANLGVLLVVYGYIAYTFQRYTNGMAKVNGTGNVTPVF